MKKLFALIAVLGMLYFSASKIAIAQEATAAADSTATEQVTDLTADAEETAAVAAEEGKSLHSQLKQNSLKVGQDSCLLC